MRLIYSQTNRLKQLDQLIRLKCTGSPNVLASKLKISRRHVWNYIKLLEELGADISYCRSRKSYIYNASYKLNIDISLNEVGNESYSKYNGGGVYCALNSKLIPAVCHTFL